MLLFLLHSTIHSHWPRFTANMKEEQEKETWREKTLKFLSKGLTKNTTTVVHGKNNKVHVIKRKDETDSI